MEKQDSRRLLTGGLSRTTHTVSIPAEAEPIIQDRLKVLGMTFQEYVASLVAYDCWSEKPHQLTGDACKGHKGSKKAKEDEGRLWAEIIAAYGKPNKTGSFFQHHLDRARGAEPPLDP